MVPVREASLLLKRRISADERRKADLEDDWMRLAAELGG